MNSYTAAVKAASDRNQKDLVHKLNMGKKLIIHRRNRSVRADNHNAFDFVGSTAKIFINLMVKSKSGELII